MSRKVVKVVLSVIAGFIICLSVVSCAKNYQYEKWINEMKAKKEYSIKIETPVEHKKLKQDGYKIHYFVSGDNTMDLIVLLHPAFGDHRCFDKQIDYFSKQYRVIAIDLLGHGLSKIDKSKDKIDVSVEHLKTIIEREGYEKAHFVGISMGTLIAQYFALKYPDTINSLTVLGGYGINRDNKEVANAQRFENFKWIAKALFSMNSFRRHVATITVINPEEQARFYEMASLFTRKSFMVMSGLGNIIKPRDNIIRAYPLLIMNGDKDIELSIKISKSWHSEESDSKFHLVSNAGHCANMDNAQEFNEIVMDFITQKE